MKISELIDRQLLLNWLDFGINSLSKPEYYAAKVSFEKIKELVEKMPVSEKRGKWIMVKPRRCGRNATYRCTACNRLRSSYYNDVQEWEYCPCGAKMER